MACGGSPPRGNFTLRMQGRGMGSSRHGCGLLMHLFVIFYLFDIE